MTDEVIVQVSRNAISEAILDTILTNKSKFVDFKSTQELTLKRLPDQSNTVLMKEKKPTKFAQVMQEAKSTQTVVDMKVKREARQVTNISNILNSILKLKNIKKPLMRLPKSSDVAKKMKYETKLKLCEQYFVVDIDSTCFPHTSWEKITELSIKT